MKLIEKKINQPMLEIFYWFHEGKRTADKNQKFFFNDLKIHDLKGFQPKFYNIKFFLFSKF